MTALDRARILCSYLLVLTLASAITVSTQAQTANEKTPASSALENITPEQTPTAQPRDKLTFNNIGHLWSARLEAACDVLTDDIRPSQRQCLSVALDSLSLALSHFQAPDTELLETLEQIETLLPAKLTDMNDPGQQQAAEYLRSLARAVPFHPACLDQLVLSLTIWPDLANGLMVCEPSYPMPIEIRDYEGKRAIWATRPTESLDSVDSFDLGSTVYLIEHHTAEDDNQTYHVTVQTETGGTGIFASLWILHQVNSLSVFEPSLNIMGGDRCNDGNLQILRIFSDGEFSYSQNATPFRLLNLYDTIDQRNAFIINRYAEDESEKIDLPDLFMGWAAYTDVDNCAMCCAGELYKQADPLTGESDLFAVGIKNNLTIEHFFPQQALVDCSREWFGGLAMHETNLLGREAEMMLFETGAWLDHLEALREACAGVPHD